MIPLLLATLLACQPGPSEPGTGGPADDSGEEVGGGDDTAEQPAATLVPLEGGRLLRRLSLDLRGILPSLEDLARVEADPEEVWVLRDEYLEDPLFEEQLVHLLNEHWLTRADQFPVASFDFGLSTRVDYEFDRSVGEEPLRLMARIAADDRPWTDILTADFSMANEYNGQVNPVDYPEGGTGWQEVHYLDGRPDAGVLSTNGLMWRYPTEPFNQNRTRAAAIVRLLVCQDLLSREVSFSSTDLEEGFDTSTMVRSNPYCLACHSTIEPLAASLWGFHWVTEYSAPEMVTYHAERELDGPEELGVEAAWYGQPVSSLNHLGLLISLDARFAPCAVKTMSEGLWRRPSTLGDLAEQQDALAAFKDSGLLLKDLIRTLTEGARYRAGDLSEGTPPAGIDRERLVRLLTPEQVQSVVEELTGFTMITWDNVMLDADAEYGMRVLAGGVDGSLVTRPQMDPSVTWSLVHQRHSEAVADDVVDQDLASSSPRLLTLIDETTTPADAAFREQTSLLVHTLHSVPPTEEQLDELDALWELVEAADGPEAAWKAVLVALLRSPAFLTY